MKDHLQKFSQITKNSKEYQGHGWGCAYLVEDEWRFYKNIRPIWEDNFDSFPSTNLLVAHARSAFKDQDIHVDYNMPFYNQKYVFIFNGELHGVKIKESGKSGAEKIFNHILRFDKNDIKEAIHKSIKIINKRTRHIKAMNFIIADKQKAYVYSDFNEDPDYFTLKYKNNHGQTLIKSEINQEELDWEKLNTKEIKVF
jgi:glutamine amidotransferase